MNLDARRDEEDLARAVSLLEFLTWTTQVAKYIGRPVEKAMGMLPARVLDKVGEYTEACLKAAFRVVLLTVNTETRFKKANNLLHKGMVVATGATGGFFGGLTMAAELPVSTGIMMRSIAEVAREEGEDLTSVDARLACISVLGLDTSSYHGSDGVHAAKYFLVRNAMAVEATKAAEFLAASAVADESAPIVAKFLNKVAERFGVQLTDKMVADLVPVVGAVSGASINYLFMDHFQRIARGHFIVRRLERKYGRDRVQAAYEAILNGMIGGRQDGYYDIEEIAVTRED